MKIAQENIYIYVDTHTETHRHTHTYIDMTKNLIVREGSCEWDEELPIKEQNFSGEAGKKGMLNLVRREY